MSVDFYTIGTVEDSKLTFAVICARFNNQWIFVRHKDRDTWEIPGGHREYGETIIETAKRELFEETGALQFDLDIISDCSIEIYGGTRYGRLFYAEVQKIGKLPPLEIDQIEYFTEIPDHLTYPHTHPYLYRKVLLRGTRL
ncbi:MAG: hydrolase [Sporomusa sp.]|nr:hydrolase [Sporomusa sp.]